MLTRATAEARTDSERPTDAFAPTRKAHGTTATSANTDFDVLLHLMLRRSGATTAVLARCTEQGVDVLARAGASDTVHLDLRMVAAMQPRRVSPDAQTDDRGGSDSGDSSDQVGWTIIPLGIGSENVCEVVALRIPIARTGRDDTFEDLYDLARLASTLLKHNDQIRSLQDECAGVFQDTPSPLWIYDPKTLRFLDANRTAVALYGYSHDAFLRMTILDIRPDSECQRIIDAVRDQSDLDGMSVWRHRKADGTEFDAATIGKSVRFRGADAVLVLAVDRTEARSLEKSLGETRLMLDYIIDALPIGVFLKDMHDEGRYIIYNSALGETVGRDPRAILGRRDADIFAQEDATKFVIQDQQVMAGSRQLVVGEETVTRPNGNVLWIKTIKKPLPSTDEAKPRYLLGLSEDITERRESQDRLAHMALHDALTDLPNRTLFKERLDRALTQRRRPLVPVVLYLDLDFFKVINDTYGHHVGDTLLKKVALRLRGCLRRSDVVARLGGDEFAILTKLEDQDQDQSQRLADRILAAFDLPFDLEECVVHVDASIGIAVSTHRGDSSESMMRYADLALYAAKAEGRGLARIYDESMGGFAKSRHLMTEDLRIALRESHFTLAYQPLFDLQASEVTGFEALLRWRHPTRGLISPADFIPLAEQTGLIVPIGEWVLREACREAACWPSSVRIAVNLSAVQFKKADFVATVEAALAAAGLSPHRLELEVTESVLLNDGSNIDILHRLRALGIRIAMDDFGTGYSSLSYLRSFPFDKIKMDRSFVADVCDSPGSLAIVRAVTGLGSSLSMTTTAEGIETLEQFTKLKAEGFDELQGFLIGRPMPASDARVLANARRCSNVSAIAV